MHPSNGCSQSLWYVIRIIGVFLGRLYSSRVNIEEPGHLDVLNPEGGYLCGLCGPSMKKYTVSWSPPRFVEGHGHPRHHKLLESEVPGGIRGTTQILVLHLTCVIN